MLDGPHDATVSLLGSPRSWGLCAAPPSLPSASGLGRLLSHRRLARRARPGTESGLAGKLSGKQLRLCGTLLLCGLIFRVLNTLVSCVLCLSSSARGKQCPGPRWTSRDRGVSHSSPCERVLVSWPLPSSGLESPLWTPCLFLSKAGCRSAGHGPLHSHPPARGCSLLFHPERI